jgi:hypothetical protein
MTLKIFDFFHIFYIFFENKIYFINFLKLLSFFVQNFSFQNRVKELFWLLKFITVSDWISA